MIFESTQNRALKGLNRLADTDWDDWDDMLYGQRYRAQNLPIYAKNIFKEAGRSQD